MILEVIGASGTGKTYHSKLIESNFNIIRIKDNKVKFKISLHSKFKCFFSSVKLTFKFRPSSKEIFFFYRILYRLHFIGEVYKQYDEDFVLDQGILYSVSRLMKKSPISEYAFYDALDKSSIKYPDYVIFLYGPKRLIAERRQKRKKKMDAKYIDFKVEKIPVDAFTKLSHRHSFLIEQENIELFRFKVKNDNGEGFIKFFKENIIERLNEK